MTDRTLPMPPMAYLLLALDDFYIQYREALPALTEPQIRMIYYRLDRYAREVEDDASRVPIPREQVTR